MVKTGESKKMVERRTPARLSPQPKCASDAVEIATRAEARIDGHEDLCTERFKNLSEDIKQLSGDAKAAISELSSRQDNNHRTNTEALGKVATSLAELTQKVAVGQGKQDGANGAGSITLKIIQVVVPVATLIYLVFGHHS